MCVLSSLCDNPDHQDVNEAASCQALLSGPDGGATSRLNILRHRIDNFG
jgi:hypothetical protein